MPHAGKEAAFLGQRAGVRHNGKGVHLQAVVIVEAQGLVLDHTLVQLKAALLQPLAAAGMAGVQNGHIVFFGHFVDGGKQGNKVLFRVNVFFAVGRKQNIFALFQPKASVNIRCLDLFKVLMQHFGHGGTGHIGALFGQAGIGQIAAGVLGVSHVHIRNDIHDAAVGFFGQALILAAVTGFHMENGNVQALGTDHGKAAVGIAQHQHGIGLNGGHQLVAFGNNIAHGFAQICAHGVHIHLGVCQLQVMEKHTVQVVIIILAGVR